MAIISGGRVGVRVWYAWTCCTLGSGFLDVCLGIPFGWLAGGGPGGVRWVRTEAEDHRTMTLIAQVPSLKTKALRKEHPSSSCR